MNAREITDALIHGFDRARTITVEQAVANVLRSSGMGQFAADESAVKIADRVLSHLHERTPEELPFQFGRSDERRLVGKARARVGDSPLTVFVRKTLPLVSPLLDLLVEVSPDEFEVIAAAAIALSGGEEMRALCTGDEGGVDFYGRLCVRPASESVQGGLAYTTLLPKRLLVLGQAKRYARDSVIGRAEIQKFKGQIEDCLKKYEGNDRPPAHRVPETFYFRDEPCLGVFVTTASFAGTTQGTVAASGVTLVSGAQLAQFLVHHRIGVREDSDSPQLDRTRFRQWLDGQRLEMVHV